MHTKAINAAHRYHEFFGNIYHYREYLKQSVARDLRKKYKRSKLGYVWSMLNPLFMMIVLTIVFSNIMSRVESYSVFLFSGLLAWQYFTVTVNQSLGSIRSNMKIIEQVPIPKYIFTLSIACSSLVNFLLALVPLVLVMLVVGRPIHITFFAFPLIMLPLFITSVGVALLFAVSNVFFEDTLHLSRVLISAWYYFCPVLYGPEHLPEWLIKWEILNPMFYIVESMRGIFYYGTLPDPLIYLWTLVYGLIILAVALWVFKKCDDKFIYFV